MKNDVAEVTNLNEPTDSHKGKDTETLKQDCKVHRNVEINSKHGEMEIQDVIEKEIASGDQESPTNDITAMSSEKTREPTLARGNTQLGEKVLDVTCENSTIRASSDNGSINDSIPLEGDANGSADDSIPLEGNTNSSANNSLTLEGEGNSSTDWETSVNDSIPLEDVTNTSADWETCDDELSDSSDTSDEEEDNGVVIEKRTNTTGDDESSDHEVLLKNNVATDSEVGLGEADTEQRDEEEDGGAQSYGECSDHEVVSKDSVSAKNEASVEGEHYNSNSNNAKDISQINELEDSTPEDHNTPNVSTADTSNEWETFEEGNTDHDVSENEVILKGDQKSDGAVKLDNSETKAKKTEDHRDCEQSSLLAQNYSNAEAGDQTSEWETFEDEVKEGKDNHEDKPSSLEEHDGFEVQTAHNSSEWETFEEENRTCESSSKDYVETNKEIEIETSKVDNVRILDKSEITASKSCKNYVTKEGHTDTTESTEDNENADEVKKNLEEPTEKQIEDDETSTSVQRFENYNGNLNTSSEWETCDESDTSCDTNDDIEENITNAAKLVGDDDSLHQRIADDETPKTSLTEANILQEKIESKDIAANCPKPELNQLVDDVPDKESEKEIAGIINNSHKHVVQNIQGSEELSKGNKKPQKTAQSDCTGMIL